MSEEREKEAIAVIGMAGRFPGARNVREFWRNLCNGVESVRFFTVEELLAAGIDPELLQREDYVRARAPLEDIEQFDAAFFGYNPRDAEILDPQQRCLLECSWEALEDAGYDPEIYEGAIGVYAGGSINSYLLMNIATNPDLISLLGVDQLRLANRPDNLATRISYKLNLRGPSLTLQTACSTSLVAVHMACQALLDYQCDMALAGGVCIESTQMTGYLYEEGGIVSRDGHCRAFDHRANGTIVGNGAGMVVLKRLEDALADGDHCYAVIRGSAINNDGATKVGYTAPSVMGQAEVIAEALALAGVEAETIDYIETHGTGTTLGDPIEIAALQRVFRSQTLKKGFCALGSVKTNIGHLDTAAGVAGLIKTTLAFEHGQIPPSLHFEQPNPQIDFANSPFFVNIALREWTSSLQKARRAGVSSFGIGGTNAHMVLEEAPARAFADCPTRWRLLPLSARNEVALQKMLSNLGDYLQEKSTLALADVAYTLQAGRRSFPWRATLVCQDTPEAALLLQSGHILSKQADAVAPPLIFLFPGQGSQYVNMGRELYRHEAVFREEFDRCSTILLPHLGCDLRASLYLEEDCDETTFKEVSRQLEQTWLAQPALFSIEYALAQLWLNRGIQPQAMLGHSIGEYVAACLAGVFSLEDALALVAIRGKLMQQLPTGAMLAVPLSEREIRACLPEGLAIASVNGPAQCVVSGPDALIEGFVRQLQRQGVEGQRLHTSHAFHSPMVEPIYDLFAREVQKIKLSAPRLRYISNLSGTWITSEEAVDPIYWAEHLRQTVQFESGIRRLVEEYPQGIFLEVGPGQTLRSLLRQQFPQEKHQRVLTSLRHPGAKQADGAILLQTLGMLWQHGVTPEWSKLYPSEHPQRVSLPTYPWQHQRYWIEPGQGGVAHGQSSERRAPLDDWFAIPSWQRTTFLPQLAETSLQAAYNWLIFCDKQGLGEQIAHLLEQYGQNVICVRPGNNFAVLSTNSYQIRPAEFSDYAQLVRLLTEEQSNAFPQKIIHTWLSGPMTQASIEGSLEDALDTNTERGFYSLLSLAQALGQSDTRQQLQLTVVTSQMQEVVGDEIIDPSRALVLGPCKIIPLEYEHITCKCVDLDLTALEPGLQQQAHHLIAETCEQTDQVPGGAVQERMIAYRGTYRWLQSFLPQQIEARKPTIREGGVYLITGGLGGLGLTFALYLAREARAKLVLLGRRSFPDRDTWEAWRANHDEQDPVSKVIQTLQEMEKYGAQVLIARADVSSRTDMQQVFVQIQKQFGQINGVIHAAGLGGDGIMQLKTREMAERVLAPKVRGTLVLAELLDTMPLDFFVLCSSLNAILGGLGNVDYCSANAFLDAFVSSRRMCKHQFLCSINWDAWQEVGMAVNADVPEDLRDWKMRNLAHGILSGEGIQVFERFLSSRLPRVLVSTRSLSLQFEEMRHFTMERLLTTSQQLSMRVPEQVYARSAFIQNPYIEPRDDVERAIAEIWAALLGMDQVGIEDNFFALGGHSLMAIQVVARLRQIYPLDFTLRDFFNHEPTIASLSATIQEMLLAKLETLTDEQALQFLETLKEV